MRLKHNLKYLKSKGIQKFINSIETEKKRFRTTIASKENDNWSLLFEFY